MNGVTPVTFPKAAAVTAWREYLKAANEGHHHAKDYAAIAGAYRALARGHCVIDLLNAMTTAGVDEKGWPRLAIVRADASQCYYRCGGDLRPFFSSEHGLPSGRTKFIELPQGTMPAIPGGRWDWLRAAVPIIPPRYLPGQTQLKKYYVLFEPEWKVVPKNKDPMLLRRLGGWLFAVVAAWDLTDVEMLAMSSRLR